LPTLSSEKLAFFKSASAVKLTCRRLPSAVQFVTEISDEDKALKNKQKKGLRVTGRFAFSYDVAGALADPAAAILKPDDE